MDPKDILIASVVLRAYVLTAQKMGCNTEAVLLRHDVARDLLEDDDARLPFNLFVEVVPDLVEEIDDENLGLQTGARATWGHALEYLAHSSSTLEDALHHIIRYAHVANNKVDMVLETNRTSAIISGTFPTEICRNLNPRVLRQEVDTWLSMFVSLGRAVTGSNWNPIEVCFTYPCPVDTKELEAFFRAPLQFSSQRNQITLDRSLMDIPATRADTALKRILDTHCKKLLETLPTDSGYAARTRRTLAEEIPRQVSSLHFIAKLLGLSSRTLQRRLAEEGTSHKELLEETRYELSLRYLRDPRLNMTEIALLLGYAESGPFLRAFKRWTGENPTEYRRQSLLEYNNE